MSTIKAPKMKPVPKTIEMSQNLHISKRRRIFPRQEIEVQTHLVLLCFCFIVLHRYYIFTHWRFVATLHQTSLLAPLFQQHLITSCLCHFGNSHNISNFYIIIVTFVVMICDQWPLMELFWSATNHTHIRRQT